MGSLGYTVFCENGHIVESTGHHEMVFENETECGICGSTNLRTITEWGDPDYETLLVPLDPIRKESVVTTRKATVRTDNGVDVTGNLVMDVDIYDVSELFRRKK
jgi:hypothetical protein